MIVITYWGVDEARRSHNYDKSSILIGRAPGNDLVLENARGVSRYHAQISYHDGKLYVRDLSSTNGTFVNGVQTDQSEIFERDEIVVGETVLSVSCSSLDTIELVDELESGSLAASRAPFGARDLKTDVIFDAGSFYSVLSPIEEFIRDDEVSEVMINGAESVYVNRLGSVTKTDVVFEEEDLISALIASCPFLASLGKRGLPPTINVAVSDGTTVSIVTRLCSPKGMLIILKKSEVLPCSLDGLVALDVMSAKVRVFLEACLRLRRSIIISGSSARESTSSARNALFYALLDALPFEERIVLLQNRLEHQAQHPHLLVLRTGFTGLLQSPEQLRVDLVQAGLRLHPDRLAVDDLIGAECYHFIQSIDACTGSFAALDAASPEIALSRIEYLAQSGLPGIPLEILQLNISQALDLIVHLDFVEGLGVKISRVS